MREDLKMQAIMRAFEKQAAAEERKKKMQALISLKSASRVELFNRSRRGALGGWKGGWGRRSVKHGCLVGVYESARVMDQSSVPPKRSGRRSSGNERQAILAHAADRAPRSCQSAPL